MSHLYSTVCLLCGYKSIRKTTEKVALIRNIPFSAAMCKELESQNEPLFLRHPVTGRRHRGLRGNAGVMSELLNKGCVISIAVLQKGKKNGNYFFMNQSVR